MLQRREPLADETINLIEFTADIVSAYISNNPVPVASLPDLIHSVNLSLRKVGQPVEPEKPVLTPAVNPKKSVFPDYIVCLEDGKQFKSLKRHLMTHYNLTPEQYREKWSLARDYPMVAPSYSEARSSLAKSMGLGRKVAPTKKAAAKVRKKAG
ncbi:MucR family transcriptional regulator [Mesorhizobium salmacidum]|uniref:MucR family transcriptional regulator n=1 Tax=Mesorhizobium salmacidum TaxID=3015171 RepID=A0ABU8KSA4_9HYPH